MASSTPWCRSAGLPVGDGDLVGALDESLLGISQLLDVVVGEGLGPSQPANAEAFGPDQPPARRESNHDRDVKARWEDPGSERLFIGRMRGPRHSGPSRMYNAFCETGSLTPAGAVSPHASPPTTTPPDAANPTEFDPTGTSHVHRPESSDRETPGIRRTLRLQGTRELVDTDR